MMCSRADVTVPSHYREPVSRPEENDLDMMPKRLLPGTGWSGTVKKIRPPIKWPSGRSQIWRTLDLEPGICDPESLVRIRS